MKNCSLAEKKEYFAVDFLKLVAAYLNISVHFMIFEDINKEFNFWWTQVLCRLAVPFFFVASGYFAANKLQDKEKVSGYLKRIFLMYVIYTVIFLPYNIENYKAYGYTFTEGLLEFLKAFFLTGSYFHLWYFLALMVGIIILYVLINHVKLDDKKLLLVTGVLYCIGVLGNAYRNIWTEIPIMEAIWTAYESVFMTTRNGIFFAPLMLLIGYLIRKHSAKIMYKRYWLYAIIFFAIMNVEEYFARAITNHSGQSMLFSTPLAVAAVFLTACFIRAPKQLVPVGVFFRNMSVLVYGLHIFIHLEYGPELSGYSYVMVGFTYFLMMAKRITILSAAIVALSRFKIFSWLKYLY